jgi:hypothetical protein
VGEPAVNACVAGVPLIAGVLLDACSCEQDGIVDPPDGAFTEAVNCLSPELVAIAGEDDDVDGAATERPEAAVGRAPA